MSDCGVFAVSRGIWEHPLFEREPFSRREAWLWLVSAARFKSGRIGIAGRVIHIERGEFCFALRFLEAKFGWKKDAIARFLKTLQKHDMIRDEYRDGIKIYKIVNYNEYQVVGIPERDNNATETATAPRHDRDKEEEGIIRDNKKYISSPKSKSLLNGDPNGFAEFYAAFPRHVARAAAEKAYARAVKAGADPKAILAGAQRYAIERKGEDLKYTAYPASWLNAGRWADETGPPANSSVVKFDPKVLERERQLTEQWEAELEAARKRQTG